MPVSERSDAEFKSIQGTMMTKSLVARSKQGEERAVIWRFLMAYEPIMWQRCRQLIRSHQEAEDVFSDLRLRLFGQLERQPDLLGSIQNIAAWVRRVASNHCIDHLRRTPRTCDLESANVDLEDNICWQPQALCPELQACLQEEIDVLEKALSSLPKPLSDLLEQRCIHGLEYHELARLYTLSEPNLRKRVQLARRQLRCQLDAATSRARQ
ncbi:hypothetical protein NS2R_10305 [Pseudomonas oryzihabitans]|nr:hypothetical protein BJP27_02255 [Pseudomonas psychrotolerans]KTT12178.1 hypothetical protein NS2R_10305 [Pseudomonas psychrotolerans]